VYTLLYVCTLTLIYVCLYIIYDTLYVH